MFYKRLNSSQPEINGGSMADLAFLLLVFFMVTTSIDQDYGYQKLLPEKDAGGSFAEQRNVFEIYMDASGDLMIQGKAGSIHEIPDKLRKFLSDRSRFGPERQMVTLPFLGKFEKSQAVVRFEYERESTYERFLEVQDAIMLPINETRDSLSLKFFGVSYLNLSSSAKTNAEAKKKKQAIEAVVNIPLGEVLR